MTRYVVLLALLLCLPVRGEAWQVVGGGEATYSAVDMATFTEYGDTTNKIAAPTATTVAWEELVNNTSARLAKSVATSGDFAYRYTYLATYRTYEANLLVFGFASDNLDRYALKTGSKDGAYVIDTENGLHIVLLENGTERFSTKVGTLVGEPYYVTFTRDDDGGTNGTGLYTMTVREGSHTGTVLGTVSISASAGEQNDFTYILCPAAYNNADGSSQSSGSVSNLEQYQ